MYHICGKCKKNCRNFHWFMRKNHFPMNLPYHSWHGVESLGCCDVARSNAALSLLIGFHLRQVRLQLSHRIALLHLVQRCFLPVTLKWRHTTHDVTHTHTLSSDCDRSGVKLLPVCTQALQGLSWLQTDQVRVDPDDDLASDAGCASECRPRARQVPAPHETSHSSIAQTRPLQPITSRHDTPTHFRWRVMTSQQQDDNNYGTVELGGESNDMFSIELTFRFDEAFPTRHPQFDRIAKHHGNRRGLHVRPFISFLLLVLSAFLSSSCCCCCCRLGALRSRLRLRIQHSLYGNQNIQMYG